MIESRLPVGLTRRPGERIINPQGVLAVYVENVHLTGDNTAVEIIDQTLLPGEKRMIQCASPAQCREAISSLRVRGAPAIGIFAGYALYVLATQEPDSDPAAFLQNLQRHADYLGAARPTAVNLRHALDRMLKSAEQHLHLPREKLLETLRLEAESIQREDVEMNRAISDYGLRLLHPGDGILTHCNAGPLATSRYGTALGPVLLGQEQGFGFHVYADETRPLLQGARLTAYDLKEAGVDVTLICDNMASVVMAQGKIQACLVGCDRIAANGDTANKIGTSGLAILAKHYGIPFYVLGPSTTIDLATPTGAEIEIEEREGSEIAEKYYSKPQAPAGIQCYNPAFDVTPAALITAIITERGVFRYPFLESFKHTFKS